MANENHISASGLWGVDEALQQELDAVQAVYFPPGQEICSSSDSEDECSDEEGSDALFERSAALTPCDDGDEDPHENPEPSDVSNEVSDECIQMFLSTSCQCSLGPNGRPCSTLFSKATVLEMRYQCLELTADQLDILIQRKGWYEAIPLKLLSERSSSLQENLFVCSLDIEKETFQPEMSLKK